MVFTYIRYDVLSVAFPEHSWIEEEFQLKSFRIENHYWKDFDNCQDFMHALSTALGVSQHEDWYKVSKSEITKHGGWGLLEKYTSFPNN